MWNGVIVGIVVAILATYGALDQCGIQPLQHGNKALIKEGRFRTAMGRRVLVPIIRRSVIIYYSHLRDRKKLRRKCVVSESILQGKPLMT